jgi:hypothetical protein
MDLKARDFLDRVLLTLAVCESAVPTPAPANYGDWYKVRVQDLKGPVAMRLDSIARSGDSNDAREAGSLLRRVRALPSAVVVAQGTRYSIGGASGVGSSAGPSSSQGLAPPPTDKKIKIYGSSGPSDSKADKPGLKLP